MKNHVKKIGLALMLGCGLLSAPAEERVVGDTAGIKPSLQIEEVLVVAQKAEVHSEAARLITQITEEQIQALPIQTIADILQYLPGLDVRTRGANGVQADISMRGGTFDQVLVLLNGVSLGDCQTGHYALNIPISSAMIERIEVLQGTAVSMFGAFSGAINIVTKSRVESGEWRDIDMQLSAGMNGLVHPEIAASIQAGETQVNVSAEYSRSDGYYAPRPTEKEQKACRNSDFQLANV